MKSSSGVQPNQERVQRAVEMVAISGLVEDNRSLQESCLALCNLCRECVPWRGLRVEEGLPSTLLAVFWPDLGCAEADGASRVLLPRRVLTVNWTHEDSALHVMEIEQGWEQEDENEMGGGGRGEEGEEEEEKEGEGEEEEEEEEEEENVRCSYVTPGNIDLSKVRWPEGVREINLSSFNRPVEYVTWPDSLEVLSFHMHARTDEKSEEDSIFDKPLDGVTFPAGLRELFLGLEFDQCIVRVAWPEGLELLSMPGFNQPIQDVQWPSGLKTLELAKPYAFENRESQDYSPWGRQPRGFDQPLGTFLPASLETLLLSDNFDQPLRGVTWPSGLAVLGLGTGVSKESIDGVEWPPSLRKLMFSRGKFDVGETPADCRVIFNDPFGVDSDGDSDVNSDGEFDIYPEEDFVEDWYVDGADADYGVDYDSAGSDFSL